MARGDNAILVGAKSSRGRAQAALRCPIVDAVQQFLTTRGHQRQAPGGRIHRSLRSVTNVLPWTHVMPLPAAIDSNVHSPTLGTSELEHHARNLAFDGIDIVVAFLCRQIDVSISTIGGNSKRQRWPCHRPVWVSGGYTTDGCFQRGICCS